MSKIAILTDSGSGYPLEEAKANNVYVLPLQVIVDNVAYEDGVTLTTSQLNNHLKNKKVPKTSTPTFATILAMFDQIIEDGYDQIIALPLSRSLSSTADYFKQAAQEKEIDLVVVEIYTTMFLQKHLTDLAQRYVTQGFSTNQIVEKLNEKIDQAHCLIMPSDLNHLKAGGRLTPAAASLAALLKIRPILALSKATDGKIDVVDKVRTDKKALNSAIKLLKKQFDKKDVVVYIGHSDAYEKAEVTKQLLVEAGFSIEDIIIQDIVAVIASHTGLDCVGIQIIEK